jgi:hypothetical protein
MSLLAIWMHPRKLFRKPAANRAEDENLCIIGRFIQKQLLVTDSSDTAKGPVDVITCYMDAPQKVFQEAGGKRC